MSDANTKRSLLLTDANDLDLSTQTLQVATGLQSMKQAVRSSILLFLGEWFLNTDEGTPWHQTILVKNPNLPLIKAALRDRITRVPGVRTLQSLDIAFNASTRTLSGSYVASCDFGKFDDDVPTPKAGA